MFHPSLKTPLCEQLGIEYPVLQAGMGFVAIGDLVGAVSEAGGLGTLGAATMNAAKLREEIATVRRVTDKPFAVDLLFAKGGSSEAQPFTDDVAESIEVVFEEKVPILVSGLGDPGPIVERCHNANMKVLSLTGNTKNARRLQDSGVDAVIAQGYDGGGHTGRVGGMALLPAVLDALDIPVVYAGGVGDGRGLAATFVMGGQGVWCGTRFIATYEAWGHDNYKNAIVEIGDEGTIRTKCFSGKPCRMYANGTTSAWENAELQATIEPFPLQMRNVSKWLGKDPYMAGRRDGEMEIGACAMGQSAAVIKAVKPAGDVVLEIMEEATKALERVQPIK
ncbi:MAG: nitronate monooxygenase [Pseudomonadales bacterium]|nr:nitronate monooxygenase [Pseudomonadales bacterium]